MTFQAVMPSMMTTCAAHQVRPEAHAVVLDLFAAFIDFSPLLDKSKSRPILSACQKQSHVRQANVLTRTACFKI